MRSTIPSLVAMSLVLMLSSCDTLRNIFPDMIVEDLLGVDGMTVVLSGPTPAAVGRASSTSFGGVSVKTLETPVETLLPSPFPPETITIAVDLDAMLDVAGLATSPAEFTIATGTLRVVLVRVGAQEVFGADFFTVRPLTFTRGSCFADACSYSAGSGPVELVSATLTGAAAASLWQARTGSGRYELTVTLDVELSEPLIASSITTKLGSKASTASFKKQE